MKTKIQNLINQARKSRDCSHLSAYQTILASIQEREARENVSLTDDQILGIIDKERKLFKESADVFAGKNPAESTTYRIKAEICADLLPEKIDPAEYENIVSESLQETGAESVKDMGKVMGYLTKKFGKSVDMGAISSIVREKLNN